MGSNNLNVLIERDCRCYDLLSKYTLWITVLKESEEKQDDSKLCQPLFHGVSQKRHINNYLAGMDLWPCL